MVPQGIALAVVRAVTTAIPVPMGTQVTVLQPAAALLQLVAMAAPITEATLAATRQTTLRLTREIPATRQTTLTLTREIPATRQTTLRLTRKIRATR